MRIAVIGKSGQLARSLAERVQGRDFELVFLGRPELDLEGSETIADAVMTSSPDLVINAAAYTAVDQAEDEPERAALINAIAPGALAQAAHQAGAGFIHVSTDYVYDGSGDRPYVETDPVSPLGVYGRTKLEGEKRALDANPRSVVLRTAWVYSPFGKNFVRTMLDLAQTRDRLTVVADQIGSPTSALDLADAALTIAARWRRDPDCGAGEICHVAGSGETSWCGLAAHALAKSGECGGPSAEVAPIRTSDWPTKAVRPANSRLDCSKFERIFGWRAPDWRQSVDAVVARLVAARSREPS